MANNEDFVVSIGVDSSVFISEIKAVRKFADKELSQIFAKINTKDGLNTKEFIKGLDKGFEEATRKFYKDIVDTAGKIKFDQIGGRNYSNLSTQIDSALAMDSKQSSERNRDIVRSMEERFKREDQLRQAAIEGDRNLAQQRIDIDRNQQRAIVASMEARFKAEDEANAKKASLDDKAKKELDEQIGLYPRLRYAMYDVSTMAGNLSANLLGVAQANLQAYASYESAFTAVERTVGSDATVAQVQGLREELLKLATQIPLTFGSITEIASLGAQLGVATENIAGFAETVAKFSATTNVGTTQAAQAFGALGELLNVSADQYNNLGSAIAYAGVNAVATETEILSVATAIAGVSANAGLSTEYVLGLSTSLASLRVPAEQSRGALTRVFQEISRSAQASGPSLDEFARVIGTSREEAKRLAETDIETFFTKFLNGLSSMDASQLTQSLDAMNLSDIRVTNTLARLSDNMDVVNKSMSDVNSSYAAGTQLNEAYGKVSDDFNSKIIMLSNAFTELQANAGAGLGEALKPVITLLTEFLGTLNALIKTEAGKWIAGIVTGVIGLAGALAAIVASAALAYGGLLALRTGFATATKWSGAATTGIDQYIGSILRMPGATMTAGAAIKGLSATMFSASMATRALGLAMKTALPIAAISLLFEGISLAVEAFGDAQKSAAQKTAEAAQEYFGESSGNLADAFKKDMTSGAEAIQKINVEIDTSKSAAAEWVDGLEQATGAQVALNENTISTTDSIKKQTVAYSENAKQALATMLANNKSFQELFKPGGAIEATGASGTDFAQAILGDPENGGKEYINKLILSLQKETGAAAGLIQGIFRQFAAARDLGFAGGFSADIAATELAASLGISFDAAKQLLQGLYELQNAAAATAAEVSTSASIAAAAAAANEALGGSAQEAADAIASLKDEMSNYVDQLFAGANAAYDTYNALSELGQVLIEQGDAAAYAGGSLQSAIQAIIEQDPTLAAGRLQYLLEYIIANVPTATGTINYLQQAIAGLTNGAAVAAVPFDISGFTRGLQTVSRSAGSAAAKIRTLKNYASDLAKVFERAFEIRFDGGEALDNITSSFNSMRDSIADARKTIDDLQVNIQELTADKALKEYFLEVAIAYGDTILADQLRAELAQINSDIAAAQNDIADAQAAASTTLVGNSQAAIDNRQEIRDIVQGYSEYIAALAAAGASQDTLNAAVAQSRADFLAQAKALGFSEAELQPYLASFNDMSTAVGGVTPGVTVAFNVDPALQALAELEAAASKTAGNISSAFEDVDTSIDTAPASNAFYTIEERELRGFTNRVNAGKNGIDWKTALGFDRLSTLPPLYLTKPFDTSYQYVMSGAKLAKQVTDTEFRSIATSASTQAGGMQLSWSNAAASIPGSIAAQKATAAANAAAVGSGAGASLTTSLNGNANIAGTISSKVNDARYPAGVNASSVGDAIGANIRSGISIALNALLGWNSVPRRFIRSLTGFADGGYTGAGGKYDVAGIVHRGEYVVPKSDVNQVTKVPYYMEQPRTFAGGGYTGQSGPTMVSLSPEDRALLRNVGGSGEVVLYANNEALARSVNAGNRSIVASGGRP